MRLPLLLLVQVISCLLGAQVLPTRFELSNGSETFTYEEGIRFCEQLDSVSDYITLKQYGITDAGKPLHLLIFDADKQFKPSRTKNIILIMNAIHPGEPDGVEASLMFIRDVAIEKKIRERHKDHIILVIPFYNIGGTLNRGCCSRANQNGPKEYGFRGNSRNLDLNRDFIKADALETQTFYRIFQEWAPHIFIDTHVSNGADYQYTMTLLHTQEEKYGPGKREFVRSFIPALYERMKQKSEEMSPYVNLHNTLPDSGFEAFNETPRYSNGYTSLFDCIALVPETHMLKPFEARVMATYRLLESVADLSAEMHLNRVWKANPEAEQMVCLNWACYAMPDSFHFKGYEGTFTEGAVTPKRLKYDRTKPWQKKVAYWDSLVPALSAPVPHAYIIPAAWKEVIERLKLNAVEMVELKHDTVIRVTSYHITSFETVKSAYEGHYMHYNTKVDTMSLNLRFRKGDMIVKPQVSHVRFVMNVLEPVAPDSYFNWNFFDGVLQQKEWFSDYVFEDIAAELLSTNDSLKQAFEKKRSEDPAFANSSFQQLYFIYRHSPYFEKTFMRYPVYRVD